MVGVRHDRRSTISCTRVGNSDGKGERPGAPRNTCATMPDKRDDGSPTTSLACDYALADHRRGGRSRRILFAFVIVWLFLVTAAWVVGQIWVIEYDGGAWYFDLDRSSVCLDVMTGPRKAVLDLAYSLRPMGLLTRSASADGLRWSFPHYKTWQVWSSRVYWHRVEFPLWLAWALGIAALLGLVGRRCLAARRRRGDFELERGVRPGAVVGD